MNRALLVCWLCSCAPAGIEDGVVYRSEHIELHADPTMSVCPQSLRFADGFLETTAGFLGVAVPEVTYNLYATSGACGSHAPQAAMDCTHEHTVYGNVWIHFHELVHTVAWDLGGPPTLFIEGLAEALGQRNNLPYTRSHHAVVSILDSDSFYSGDIITHYNIAADFTTYLLGRFGVAAYLRMYRALDEYADPLAIAVAFHDAFDASFDDVIDDWVQQAKLGTPLALPLTQAGCNLAPVPSLAATWSEYEPACGGGPHAGQFDEPAVATVDLIDGLYVANTDNGSVSATACPRDVTVAAAIDAEPSATPSFALASLGAGHYEVAFNSANDDGMSWELSRLGAAAATCETAPVFAPPRSWSLSMAASPSNWPALDAGRVAMWLQIEPTTSTMIFTGFDGDIGTTAMLCSGPCAAQTCVQLGGDPRVVWQPVAGQPIYLEVIAPRNASEVSVFLGDQPQNAQNTTPSRGPITSTRSDTP